MFARTGVSTSPKKITMKRADQKRWTDSENPRQKQQQGKREKEHERDRGQTERERTMWGRSKGNCGLAMNDRSEPGISSVIISMLGGTSQ